MNALASVGWCRTSVRDGIMEKPETVTEVGLMSRNQTVQRTFAAWTMAHPFISSLTLPIQTSQTWRKSEYGKLRAGDSVQSHLKHWSIQLLEQAMKMLAMSLWGMLRSEGTQTP